MQKEVRAPRGGYDNPEKQAYRERVWSALAPATQHQLDDPKSVWVLMPSREGIEIEVAVKSGIPANRILCVDKSAAVIATSTWRKRWPECQFMASMISDLPKRLKSKNLVCAAANLDLCGNFSEENLVEIESFCANAPCHDDVAIAITLMKGREGSALLRLLDIIAADVDLIDERRFKALMVSTEIRNSPWKVLDQGKYISHKMPVAWLALQKHGAKTFFKHISEVVRKAAGFERQAVEVYDQWCVHKSQNFGRGALRQGIERDLVGFFNDYEDLMAKCNEQIDKAEGIWFKESKSVVNSELFRKSVMSEAIRLHQEIQPPTTIPKTPKGWLS